MKKLKLLILILIPLIFIMRYAVYQIGWGHSGIYYDSETFKNLFQATVDRNVLGYAIVNKNDTILNQIVNNEFSVVSWRMNKFQNFDISEMKLDSVSEIDYAGISKRSSYPWWNLVLNTHIFSNKTNHSGIYIGKGAQIYEIREGSSYKFLRLRTTEIGLGKAKNDICEVYIDNESYDFFDISLLFIKKNNAFFMMIFSERTHKTKPLKFNKIEDLVKFYD